MSEQDVHTVVLRMDTKEVEELFDALSGQRDACEAILRDLLTALGECEFKQYQQVSMDGAHRFCDLHRHWDCPVATARERLAELKVWSMSYLSIDEQLEAVRKERDDGYETHIADLEQRLAAAEAERDEEKRLHELNLITSYDFSRR